QAEDGIRDDLVTGVQTCALPISREFANPSPGRVFQPKRWPSCKALPPKTKPRSKYGSALSRGLAISEWPNHGGNRSVAIRGKSRSEERRVGKECKRQNI